MTPSQRVYFVDEAGDSTLFSSTGKVLVGGEGCSRFFILGLLWVENPPELDVAMRKLRQQLLADPYFAGVPSMQPQNHKTAICFHAKDDVPEVRREVFNLLSQMHGMHFFAVVQDKFKAVEYVRQRNARDLNYRYHPNEMYDYLVRRLFRDRLHKADEHIVYFAKRGKTDRTEALKSALQQARQNFFKAHGIQSNSSFTIQVTEPKHSGGLQAVDYFLWALQRLFERGEERYVCFLWKHFSLVHDIDDTREDKYGRYYDKTHPLTADAIHGGHLNTSGKT
ncbi:MAG: DUF3800 domain-containing protein [Anaerolineales bacterium]|nr:DUF3800 domain-containing protein [Anaerolineales bacterium]